MRSAVHTYFIHASDYIELIPGESLCPSDISPMVQWAQLVPLRSCGSANEDETMRLPIQPFAPSLSAAQSQSCAIVYFIMQLNENMGNLPPAGGNYKSCSRLQRPVYLNWKA